jgi:hypothetical protein
LLVFGSSNRFDTRERGQVHPRRRADLVKAIEVGEVGKEMDYPYVLMPDQVTSAETDSDSL